MSRTDTAGDTVSAETDLFKGKAAGGTDGPSIHEFRIRCPSGSAVSLELWCRELWGNEWHEMVALDQDEYFSSARAISHVKIRGKSGTATYTRYVVTVAGAD
jgi:hypothetical protein